MKTKCFNSKWQYVVLINVCSVQHCHCEEDTQRKMDSLTSEFIKVGSLLNDISLYIDIHKVVCRGCNLINFFK